MSLFWDYTKKYHARAGELMAALGYRFEDLSTPFISRFDFAGS